MFSGLNIHGLGSGGIAHSVIGFILKTEGKQNIGGEKLIHVDTKDKVNRNRTRMGTQKSKVNT